MSSSERCRRRRCSRIYPRARRSSARDRLLLARCYGAAGIPLQAENALWDGFHDIPASEALFAALKVRVQNNADAVASLSEEYKQQRSAELYRGIL